MAKRARTVVHVDQHIIKANRKTGDANPPLTVKGRRDGKPTNDKGHQVVLRNPETGEVVGRFLYSPDKPLLSCGAHVIFETNVLDVEVEVNDG